MIEYKNVKIIINFRAFLNQRIEMELIEKVLDLYQSYEHIININFYKFFFSFILISIIWVSLIGIVTPVLLFSALSFGYFGIIISLFSLIISSLINFFIATKTKNLISKFKYKKPLVSSNPLLVYIIFRLLPGVPYLVKNYSVVFFKLNLKKFFLSVILSDTPQVLIFTFFFKRLIDSTNNIFINKNYSQVFEQMYLPIMLIICFLTFLYFLKKIIGYRLFENDK